MQNLSKIYEINGIIKSLRKDMIDLVYNESQRSLDLDTKALKQILQLQTTYDELTHERNEEIKDAYSLSSIKTRINSIPVLIIPARIKIASMNIGRTSTILSMTPHWFQPIDPDEEKKILKSIKYPSNIKDADKRSFKTIAHFRAVNKKKTNDFTVEQIEARKDSTETLVLALDAFVQQFGGKLSFTTDDLSFEESTHRTACGVADLGGVHLLASDYLSSAKFVLVLDLNYDDLAKSNETMSKFVLSFADAMAKDLSCDNDYVRVTSVEKSTKAKGKAEVNLALTTSDQTKTDELVNTLQAHARKGFSDNTILHKIKPDDYECKWMPILSYLQLKPFDFNPIYNNDYSKGGFPTSVPRGGIPYYFPKMWYRHGLKVDDKYNDDLCWLGSGNDPGVWPVAFHGTRPHAVKSITDEGLQPDKTSQDTMLNEATQKWGEDFNRPGLYVATRCNGGSSIYTEKFDVKISSDKTETFEVVFQCRVRPLSYTIHTNPVAVGEAWRIVDPTAIRPYGILLKNIKVITKYDED